MSKLPIEEIPLKRGLRQNTCLATYTTWKVGGAARWLAEPEQEEIVPLLKAASKCNLSVYFLGRGSNVLIDSSGLPGLVILTRNSLTSIARDKDRIIADAGVSLPRLSKTAAREGFKGYEFLVGIPGTVGGGIVMNAGLSAFRPKEICSVLDTVELVDQQGNIHILTVDEIEPAYRSTKLLDKRHLVLRASFRLEQPGDPNDIHKRTLEHLAERKRKQPLDKATAGSTFKQPQGGQPAGWYIENAGLKDLRIGGARISPIHANWIENDGHATSDDIESLIEEVKNRVYDQFGVTLEEEIRYLR